MEKYYWLVRGYDGLKTIFEMKVGAGQFTRSRIVHLLRALAAKDLTYSEIVGAYANPRTRIANGLLTVHSDSKHSGLVYMCGLDRNFTVSVVDESGKVIPHPTL